jgi:transposase
MPVPSTSFSRFIGCDVGKNDVTIFDSQDGSTRTIANEPVALAAFAAELDAACLVVCEATGGYERALLDAVTQAGHATHRADARKVKAFIRSFGTLGKTDAIDANALARYGQERQADLARWQSPDPNRARLQALVSTRADLVAQRVACNNRLAAPSAQPVATYLGALLTCLETQIHAIEADILALVRHHPALRRDAEILRTITGLGERTIAVLLALMPELGHLGRRQAAALAGLAPHPRQSGIADGYRRIRGGRPTVKKALFMAALAAARHNPTLRAFYQRLIANGKKPLVALTAVMRKIIVIANARLKPAHNPI